MFYSKICYHKMPDYFLRDLEDHNLLATIHRETNERFERLERQYGTDNSPLVEENLQLRRRIDDVEKELDERKKRQELAEANLRILSSQIQHLTRIVDSLKK